MRRRSSSLRLALTSVACVALPFAAIAGASCSSSAPRATRASTVMLAPSILGSQGLIDATAVFVLNVYDSTPNDGGPMCASTGAVSNVSGVTPIYTSGHVLTVGCGNGDTRCIIAPDLTQSSQAKIFGVTAYGDQAQTDPIGYGCASLVIDGGDAETTASVNITLQPIVPAETCGDFILQPPETCDEPATDAGNPVCVSCQTVEEVLSTGSGTNDAGDGASKTVTGSVGDKSSPTFVWPVGQFSFVALFGDVSSGTSQIDLRIKSDALADTAALGPVTEANSIYLPSMMQASVFPPNPQAHNQKQPAAVNDSNGVTYVAFADDTLTPGTFAINLRSFDATLTPQQNTPCNISTTGGTGSLSSPAIAVTTNISGQPVLYVGWQDSGGHIYGRTYTPGSTGCGATGAQVMISTGSTNSNISVVGIPSGYVAAWQDGSDVVIVALNIDGTIPMGSAPIAVELQGHVAKTPVVASITAGAEVSTSNLGAFAVVWSDTAQGASASTIYAQRYTKKGLSIEDPTQISVSSNGGGEVSPFIAASATTTGSYAVVWADEGPSNQIRARYLTGTLGLLNITNAPADSSAYLNNPVDGTTGEFPVGVLANRTRLTPTVVIGGSGASYSGKPPFAAFGWVDQTPGAASGFGIVARRFPAPFQ